MTDRRALPLVLVVPVVCWLACWPFVDMAVNDDFGYSFVAKRLLETGRFIYNGWSSPLLGVQAMWGALFAAALGFSHDAMRISVLPLAVACAALAYTLHRRLEVPPRWAAFATLLLVSSPIFTPWAASFMTDVPGLVFTLGILHATLSLARATTPRATLAAALAITALGALGGSIRQTNFIFAAIPLAIELWRRRRRLATAIPIVPALLVLVACGATLIRWYARQPYATLDPTPSITQWPTSLISMTGLLLSFVLFVLPLGVAWLRLEPGGRATRVLIALGWLAACGATVAFAGDTLIANFALGLWSGSTLTPTGMLFDGVDAPGVRPTVFGLPSRVVMAAAVYSLLTLAVIALVRHRADVAAAIRRIRRGETRATSAGVLSLAALGAIYFSLLAPRAADRLVFDRYLLVLIPIGSCAALYGLRRRLADVGPGPAAWAMLVVYAAIGSAITNDHFAELRARERIARQFADAGLPRTALANGITFDGWTQLTERGYVNDNRITNPPGAYQMPPDAERRGRYFWFLNHTPAVQPRWIVANALAPPRPAGDSRAFAYRAILPPQERWLVAWPIRGLTLPTTAATPPESATSRPAASSADESAGR